MTSFAKKYIEDHIDELDRNIQEFLRTMHMKEIIPRVACSEIIDLLDSAGIPIKQARTDYIVKCIKKYLNNTFYLFIELRDIDKNLGNCCGLFLNELLELIQDNSDEWLNVGFYYDASGDRFCKSIDEESDIHF